MQKSVVIANGQSIQISKGDRVELFDGRVLTVEDVNAPFGKIKMVDEQGGVAFVKPFDIVGIIQEVIQTVEAAKGFWAWFSSSQLGTIIINFVKSKFGKK